jgi:hypothetical protein
VISLFLDEERSTPLPVLYLGEVLAPEKFDDLIEGEPVRIFARNISEGALRQVSIHLRGEGKDNAQLATDEDGNPGVWAAPGESILVERGTLVARAEFSFWARGVYHAHDTAGRKPLSIIFRGVSAG